MSEWISVEKNLPESGQKVVVAHIMNGEIYDYATAHYFQSKHGKGWGVEDDAYSAENYDGPASISLDLDITHWMPLPKPPTE